MILHGDLAPVGNRISLESSAECMLEKHLGGHQYWLDSGTSALALALLDAKTNFPDIEHPRAIIPGYCCPDLVAACVYAGVEAVAVDICCNDPAYDLEKLRLHLSENVVAIIAVNFLGIRERLNELRRLVSDLNLRARLIEDNAQWFPSAISEMEFQSDYVTFSFGRGKPMSLLGGGLLRTKDQIAVSAVAKIENTSPPSRFLALKIAAYNLLLKPQFYQMLNRNPWLRLGETRYAPMDYIAQMDSYRRTLVDSNYTVHSVRNNELALHFDSIALASGLQRLDQHCVMRQRQLLRYPLLCPDKKIRDNLLAQLSVAGLGASPMYAAAIDQITGINDLVTVPDALKNARDFAERFMTLPVHGRVTESYQKRMASLLGAVDESSASSAVR